MNEGQPDSDVARNLANAYLMELEANCNIFLRAWNEVRDEARRPPGAGPDDVAQMATRRWTYGLWRHAYTMIEAAWRMSRILWEVPGNKRFREHFHLPTGAALKPSYLRGIRNALEHMETRIPEFIEMNSGKYLSGWSATNNPHDRATPERVRLRYLNVYSFACAVYDRAGEQTCDFGLVAKAVQALNMGLPRVGGTRTVLKLPP